MPDPDPRFLRSKRLRTALYVAAGGRCRNCGAPAGPSWHADHVVPWSHSGETNVHGMQVLCPECNRKKGAKMTTDRAHQAELRNRLARVKATDLPLSILAWVVPGGGKSRLPGILAAQFPGHKIGWFVPRLSLQTQAVECTRKDFGVELRDSGNDIDPSRGTRGFVATHAALMEQPDLWADEFRRHPYVLVVDEHHHAKVERDGTRRPLSAALCRITAAVSLFMTGTLETNDHTLIHGTHYDRAEDGQVANPAESADVFIRYDRATALRERAIVPIEFLHHDGPVRWKTATTEERERRLSEVRRDEESSALYTALRTEVAVQLFECGLDHWRRRSRDGKLIVVTDRQPTAREYAKRLKAAGVRAALAIDDNDTAHDEVRQFRNNPEVQALVTCQMAYEGLDCPRASHLICLTHIRSAPWIEQTFARVWRSAPRKTRCWAFVPDDPRMNRVITAIHDEQLSVIPDWQEGPPVPPGGEREPTLALNGSVDVIHQKHLDAEFAAAETRKELVEFVGRHGLTGDEPEVRALLGALNRPRPPVAVEPTVKEQEVRLRNQINEQAKSIDAANARKRGQERPEFGETLGRLIMLTGKSIKDMNLTELKNAHTRLQTLRS